MDFNEKRIEWFDDLSNERGFQYEFWCEHCRKRFRSKFVESKQYEEEKRKRNVGAAAGFIGNLLGGVAGELGSKIEEGLNTVNDHTDDSKYDKEREAALLKAQEAVQKVLFQCKQCECWFCADCYNAETELCCNCDEDRVNREREEREQREEERRWQEEERRNREEEERARREEESRVYCPNCGAEVPEGMKFCGQCGTKVAGKKVCPECGKENETTQSFCGYCGAKLDD